MTTTNDSLEQDRQFEASIWANHERAWRLRQALDSIYQTRQAGEAIELKDEWLEDLHEVLTMHPLLCGWVIAEVRKRIAEAEAEAAQGAAKP